MTAYRFLDAMGDVVAQRDFADHATAISWAQDDSEAPGADDGEDAAEVQRVEFLGPEGDWRWAGALGG